MTRTGRLCPVRVMPGRDGRAAVPILRRRAAVVVGLWGKTAGAPNRNYAGKTGGWDDFLRSGNHPGAPNRNYAEKKTGCDPVRVAPCTLVRSDRGKGVRCRTIGPARPVAGRRTGDVHATAGMRPERTTAAPYPGRRRGEFHVTQGSVPPRAGRLPADRRYASGNRKTPGRHPECQDAGPAVVLFAIISSRRNGRPADPLHASRTPDGVSGRAGGVTAGQLRTRLARHRSRRERFTGTRQAALTRPTPDYMRPACQTEKGNAPPRHRCPGGASHGRVRRGIARRTAILCGKGRAPPYGRRDARALTGLGGKKVGKPAHRHRSGTEEPGRWRSRIRLYASRLSSRIRRA